MKMLNGQIDSGISPVGEEKVYSGKNLSKSQVLSWEWKTEGASVDESGDSGKIMNCHNIMFDKQW